MPEFSFKTLKKPVENYLLKEKGSKFIGFASSVSDEQSFKNYLTKIQQLHPKATHHCYAYRLGVSGENFRANDDGEPNGSAGLPIFNQLLAKEINNATVIVVRYYGGTKLGVSGLVKAYKTCAQETLDMAEIIIKDLTFLINLKIQFAQQNELFSLLNKFAGKILNFDAAETCIINAEIKMSDKAVFIQEVSDMRGLTFEIIEA